MSQEVMKRILGRDLSPEEFVDHINGVVHDNRRSNLRIASKRENCSNRKIHKNNSTGFRGVQRHTSNENMFIATICHNYKNVFLGSFDTAEEASAAYQAASRILHGKFTSIHR
jgi:hypothetical protein